mgnify:CR=1 FL=1
MLKTLNFLVGYETADMELTVQNTVPGYGKSSLATKDAVPKTLLLQVVFHMELIGGLAALGWGHTPMRFPILYLLASLCSTLTWQRDGRYIAQSHSCTGDLHGSLGRQCWCRYYSEHEKW